MGTHSPFHPTLCQTELAFDSVSNQFQVIASQGPGTLPILLWGYSARASPIHFLSIVCLCSVGPSIQRQLLPHLLTPGYLVGYPPCLSVWSPAEAWKWAAPSLNPSPGCCKINPNGGCHTPYDRCHELCTLPPFPSPHTMLEFYLPTPPVTNLLSLNKLCYTFLSPKTLFPDPPLAVPARSSSLSLDLWQPALILCFFSFPPQRLLLWAQVHEALLLGNPWF